MSFGAMENLAGKKRYSEVALEVLTEKSKRFCTEGSVLS